MMLIKKTASALTLIMALLFSALAGTQLVNLGRANPLPDIDPKITIENPQNTTYNVNTITLNFTVESNWGIYSLFYSLDGQKMEPIENMTTVSSEHLNPASSPPVYRYTLKGSCILSSLSEGWHNVTFYLITPHEISLCKTYEKGEIIYSTNTTLRIETAELQPTPFPITLVVASTLPVTIACIGLLVYFKKRNH